MRQAEELRFLILALQREGNRMLAAQLRPLGLTPAQGEALSVLARHQPLPLSGLGGLLVCESGTNPSRIVDRLAASGLVRREPGADDRRQVVLTLTDAGRELAAKVAAVEDRLHDTLDNLVAGHDVAPVLDLLRAMAAHFPAGEALRRRAAGPPSRTNPS